MSYINNPDITKEDILKKSLAHWNVGKTQEWIDRDMAIVMGKREGYYFWDMDGRKFLDIHINGGTYNLGHRNKEIIGALTDAMTELDIGNHHFTGITKALLAEQLTSLCPDGLDYACFSTCGGEAVDLAIKSARYVTQRKRVVSIQGCYHGHTGLSVSTGDARFKDPFLCQGAPGEFVQVPLNDLDAMEAELKKEDVACVIIESLLATYGFPIPDKGYLAGVKKLCEKYGTLYIADETQTGLMRTGKMWCFEHEGFVPDMITTAKGFGGGIYPISATVMNRKAASWMFDIGRMHGSTCGNSELGCVVAMKVLEISTRKETVDNINKNAKLLTERVNALIDKYVSVISFLEGSPLGELKDDELIKGLESLGEITAKLHMQSINRDKSVVIKRFYWDINNLFGDNNDGIWGSWRDYKALTKEQYRILEKCTSVMKDKLNHYGRSNEKFGLIHADLHFYNVINNNGVNQIIDFDDSGYGFYMYDMGCALVTYSRNLTKLEGAWVRGYEKVRKLSDEDKKFIPMFVLLRRITRLAWLATHSDSDTAKTVDDEYLDVTIDMAKEWLKANTKVAVITGAAGGIGYGIAKKFLESCK